MSRIDNNKFLEAVSERINELNKNPQDIIPDHVISNMLEESIKEEVNGFFI